MAFRRLIVIALLSGAAACVAPSRAPAPAPRPPVAAPLPAPTPSPAPAATYSSWMDVPQTPGDWRYAPAAGSSAARFGEAAGEPRFAILCSGGSQVELVRYGPFAAAAPMTVRSESATRTLTANPAPGGSGLRAVLSARRPFQGEWRTS